MSDGSGRMVNNIEGRNNYRKQRNILRGNAEKAKEQNLRGEIMEFKKKNTPLFLNVHGVKATGLQSKLRD
jgi:hypothetical protein